MKTLNTFIKNKETLSFSDSGWLASLIANKCRQKTYLAVLDKLQDLSKVHPSPEFERVVKTDGDWMIVTETGQQKPPDFVKRIRQALLK